MCSIKRPDDKTTSRPAKTDDDWQDIWRAVEQGGKMWNAGGQAWVALVTNWKAWAIAAGGIALLRGPELLTWLYDFWGIAQ